MSTAQDQLAGALVALGATITDAMDAAPGFVPCGTPSQVIIDALNTYAAADDAAIAQTTPNILAFVEHVSDHRASRLTSLQLSAELTLSRSSRSSPSPQRQTLLPSRLTRPSGSTARLHPLPSICLKMPLALI
jgi:hypothetical protein